MTTLSSQQQIMHKCVTVYHD